MKAQDRRIVNIRIVDRNLPGLRFDRSAGSLADRSQVHIGLQRDKQMIDLVPGDAVQAVFDFQVEVVSGPGGEPDFRGPFMHGGRGRRFLYLSWGEVDDDGSFVMFRRAKLALSTDNMVQELSSSPSDSGQRVECTLDLTDEGGGPICGSVAVQKMRWQVLGAGDKTGARAKDHKKDRPGADKPMPRRKAKSN